MLRDRQCDFSIDEGGKEGTTSVISLAKSQEKFKRSAKPFLFLGE